MIIFFLNWIFRSPHFVVLTIQEVGRHQYIQGHRQRYRELWYLGGAVIVTYLVHEVLADYRQNVRFYITEMYDVGLVLLEPSRAAQHGRNRIRNHGVLLFDDEFVIVLRNKCHVLVVQAIVGANPGVFVFTHVRVRATKWAKKKINK